ncbi:hypothetical protein JYT21_00430 [bacterium AH-315-B15]|nr:hypothetical protein [bacterium AH-315-B15]
MRLLAIILLITGSISSSAQIEEDGNPSYSKYFKVENFFKIGVLKAVQKLGKAAKYEHGDVEQMFCSMSRGRNEYIKYKKLGVTFVCWKGFALRTKEELNPRNKKKYYKECRINEIQLSRGAPFTIQGVQLGQITEANVKELIGEEYLFTEYEGEKTFWDIPIRGKLVIDLEFKFKADGSLKSVFVN